MTPALLAGAAVLAASLAVHRVLADGLRAAVVGGSRRPRLVAPRRLDAALDAAGVSWSPDLLWQLWLLAAVGGGLLGLAGGPALSVLVVTAVVAAPALVLTAAGGRGQAMVDAALPDLLDGIGRSLRSGATLAVAIGEAAGPTPGRLGDDLRAVVAEAGAGVALTAALDAWPARCPSPGVRLAAAALTLSAEAGGSAARAVDGVAATLRSNLAVAREVRAQSSQARMSALVIALAPLGFGALAAGTDVRTAAFLFRTPFGLACLAAGLALDGVAAWWMHRITAYSASR